jgi:hypothetical protein
MAYLLSLSITYELANVISKMELGVNTIAKEQFN